MSDKLDFPMVEVAVVVITQNDRILMGLNREWSAFTIPMSKRRVWQDPRIPPARREETWLDAATRALAEWLGRTTTMAPAFIMDIPEFQQSDRDGVWKRFHFQVFRLPQAPGAELAPGAIVEWLTPDEILDANRRPISSTARDLVGKLRGEGLL